MAAFSGVKTTIDKLRGVQSALRLLSSRRVMVGIPSTTAGRKEGPITSAALGYIHENGAPEVGIPARPFLVPGVASVQDQTAAGLRRALDQALAGRPDAADRSLHAVGLRAQSAVKAKIKTGPFAPLSERTLAARRRRGVTRTKPLIDTAQMLNAVTYVIREEK